MRRLNRREIAALWLAGVMLVASPAIASHVNEPKTPIYDIALRVYNYPHAVTILTACDGTETVTWDQARIELDVLSTMKPSEHFDVRLEYYDSLPDRRGRLHNYQWVTEWKHSNIPPHTNTERDRWEHSFTNQRLNPGGATARVSVIGLESGVVHTRVCSWIVDH